MFYTRGLTSCTISAMTDRCAVDLYVGDGNYDLVKLAAAGDLWALVALKFTEGLAYSADSWTGRMWPLAKSAWGDRYGKTAFRVPYHYLDVGVDGAAQGDFFAEHIAYAGGISYGDPFVMVDVERGGQRRPFTHAQIVKCAKDFVARIHELTGLRVVTYGGEYLRSNGIKIAEFGCEYAWVADYESHLTPSHYTLLGVDLPHLLGWQYGGLEGDGHEEVHLQGYPWTSPAGLCDLTALTLAGGGQTAIDTLASWCVQLPG